MYPLYAVAALAAACVGNAAAAPDARLAAAAFAGRKTFSLNQVAVNVANRGPWHAPSLVQRTYLKYGLEVPENLARAAARLELQRPPLRGNGKTSVPVRPAPNDVEFLVPVEVGNHQLQLDLDTGSSDLWVFSTLQPQDQRNMRPSPRVYDPAGSGATRLNGHAWQIRYGDMSGAQGQVYMDRVTVGGLTVPQQAVEAAVTVTNTFIRDNHNDGLLGLAFSKLNTVKPQAQKTWFENVLPQLAQPVFTAALKRRATGTYDFGFIDRGKFVGDLVWVNVKGTKGFWDFETTGYVIGNGPEVKVNLTGIVDTGTSLWYLPTEIADAYWKTVPGSEWDTVQQGWVYPCKNALPDVSLNVGGRIITVPGINMNYQSLSILTCFGGIQRADRMPFSIFGDVFLKGLFTAFEHPRNESGQARIGFAHMPRTNDVLVPGNNNVQATSNEGNMNSGPEAPPPADSDDEDDDDNDSQRLPDAGPRIPAAGQLAGQFPAGGSRLPRLRRPGQLRKAEWRSPARDQRVKAAG